MSKSYLVEDINGQEIVKAVLDSQIFRCLNKLISSAENKIYIGTPWIGDVGYLLDKIKQKSKDGLDVKILTRPLDQNEKSLKYKRDILKDLHDSGCELHFNKRIHFKLYIVDDVLLSTSANLTPTGMLRNHEIGILTNVKKTVSNLKRYLIEKIEDSR